MLVNASFNTRKHSLKGYSHKQFVRKQVFYVLRAFFTVSHLMV